MEIINNVSQRHLRSDYGTMNKAFVALRVNDYLSLDDAIEVAACNSLFNYVHNLRMNKLFGSMNDLLLNHAGDDCSYLGIWKFNRKLNQIPTLKTVKVNLTEFVVNKRLNHLANLFESNKYEFIRGIDITTDFPFLSFMVSNLDIGRTFIVFVLFDQTGVHSIFYRHLRSFEILHKDNNSLSMDQVVDLLKYGKCYDAFHVENSIWMLRSEVIKREECIKRLNECGMCIGGCCECVCGCAALMANPLGLVIGMIFFTMVHHFIKKFGL